MADKADWLLQVAPGNELPSSLDVGPFIWRGADVGLTATGFLVYSTGVVFTLVGRSKTVSLQDGDPAAITSGARGTSHVAGPLRYGARGARMTLLSGSRNRHCLVAETWTPFPPRGDLVFFLEWTAQGIACTEFRVPREAAAKAVTLWPPETLFGRHRGHEDLCPSFLITTGPRGDGTDLMTLRVAQHGPPSLGHLDKVTLRIRNDSSYWPTEREVIANGGNYRDVLDQVWAPYRFTPGTGPGEARADASGRETVCETRLPAGTELSFQLEPTRPGSWAGGMTVEEWRSQRGTILRLTIEAARDGHEPWTLTGTVNVTAGAETTVLVSRSGTRTVPARRTSTTRKRGPE